MDDEATTHAMLLIKSLDPSAHLELSEYTGKWYVSARIEVSDGCVIGGITEHRRTPEGAVSAFLEHCQNVPLDQVLVTNSLRGPRRHWRWNGAAFAEQPLDLLAAR